jgi:hypothetical protein
MRVEGMRDRLHIAHSQTTITRQPIAPASQSPLIPLSVSRDLRIPKRSPRRGHSEELAVVPVPKATMNEHQRVIAQKR